MASCWAKELSQLAYLGPKEEIWMHGGPVPDRFDQLFGFVMPFRPPVYSTPNARRVEDSTVVGEVDMSITRG